MTMFSRKSRRIITGMQITGGICLLFHMIRIYYISNYGKPAQQTNPMAVADSINAVLKERYIRPKLNQSFLYTEYRNAISSGCPLPQLSKFFQPLTDFETFPCLGQLTPSEQLKQNGHCVRTVNFPKDMLTDKTGCTVLKSGRGTPICTYEPDKDKYISGEVNSKGMWENDTVELMLDILKKNPDMTLLDVGCNIGVYTLAAALHSHNVISVDASFENLFLVSKSLTHGNLWGNVTLIWNAVSQKNEMVVLRKNDKNNIGADSIDLVNKAMAGCDLPVNTIILDDLKGLFINKNVYLKLAVQGEEHNALNNGKELFNMTSVRYVQLEYLLHKGQPSGKVIIDCMTAYGYLPFTDCRGIQPLNPSDESKWPYDVCFVRQNLTP